MVADVTVNTTGPLFDGRAQRALDDAEEDMADQVAEVVRDEVRAIVGQEARHATGYYESRVVVERARSDRTVTDRGVVYGPWLAGTSNRNNSSRFKGWDHFRRATQQAEALALPAAEAALQPHLKKMQ